MTKDSVIKILMRRDGTSYDEALAQINECADAIRESGYDPFEADNLIRDYLGLEPDYLFAVIDY